MIIGSRILGDDLRKSNFLEITLGSQIWGDDLKKLDFGR